MGAAFYFALPCADMGTIGDLLGELPWGLHDAFLEALRVDYLESRLELTVRLMMSERQDRDQRAMIRVDGLVYCAVEAPTAHAMDELEEGPVWIDAGSGIARNAAPGIPEAPEGCFVHWLFVRDWNAFIHICGRDATFTWLEPEPVPARADTGVLYPGDELPERGAAEPDSAPPAAPEVAPGPSIDEACAALPWGLHDAHLEALHVDYASGVAELTVRPFGSHPRTTLRVEGLVYCAVDPPHPRPERPGALWISDGSGIAPSATERIPRAPEGCFGHWLFMHECNAFIHICGRRATVA